VTKAEYTQFCSVLTGAIGQRLTEEQRLYWWRQFKPLNGKEIIEAAECYVEQKNERLPTYGQILEIYYSRRRGAPAGDITGQYAHLYPRLAPGVVKILKAMKTTDAKPATKEEAQEYIWQIKAMMEMSGVVKFDPKRRKTIAKQGVRLKNDDEEPPKAA
jgi:hypothetical protein